MKTIYNVKALCVVALLGSAAAASAQEDVTKEKNQKHNILSRCTIILLLV